jgi:formylmethanofuran dehydrogenase subunit D
MAEQFVLIPGRTNRQGTGLNQGKDSSDYRKEIETLVMAPVDMERLELSVDDCVRVWNSHGDVVTSCRPPKGEELPSGIVFIGYGELSSQLMGADTHGTGMPDSKGIDVFIAKAENA